MNYWLLGYLMSVFGTAVAYISGVSQLAELPLAIVALGLVVTFGRWVVQLRGRLNPSIRWPIKLIFFALLALMLKHFGTGGGVSNPLFVKMVLYFAVLMAGILIGFYERPATPNPDLIMLGVLFVLPFLFFLAFAKGQAPVDSATLFNRNVFASYFMLSATFLVSASGRQAMVGPVLVYCIIFLGLVAIGTLGALVAFLTVMTTTTILRSISDLKRLRVLGMTLVLVVTPLASILALADVGVEGGVWTRLTFVYQTTLNLLTGYGGTLADLDMATAVRFAASGELDMSAFFRILHWIDIYSVLAQDGISALLRGGGTDWVQRETDLFVFKLAAHNEYLRLFVEQGFILGTLLCAGFVMLGLSLRKTQVFVPVFSIIVFFGTENQLNDFLSTSILFFMIGMYFGRERFRQRGHFHKVRPTIVETGS